MNNLEALEQLKQSSQTQGKELESMISEILKQRLDSIEKNFLALLQIKQQNLASSIQQQDEELINTTATNYKQIIKEQQELSQITAQTNKNYKQTLLKMTTLPILTALLPIVTAIAIVMILDKSLIYKTEEISSKQEMLKKIDIELEEKAQILAAYLPIQQIRKDGLVIEKGYKAEGGYIITDGKGIQYQFIKIIKEK